jgi:hypothetical protein
LLKEWVVDLDPTPGCDELPRFKLDGPIQLWDVDRDGKIIVIPITHHKKLFTHT